MCHKLLQTYHCGHPKEICTTPCPHALKTATPAPQTTPSNLNTLKTATPLSRTKAQNTAAIDIYHQHLQHHHPPTAHHHQHPLPPMKNPNISQISALTSSHESCRHPHILASSATCSRSTNYTVRSGWTIIEASIRGKIVSGLRSWQEWNRLVSGWDF
jgi:hypothetical protein